jgi:translation initiation factor 1
MFPHPAIRALISVSQCGISIKAFLDYEANYVVGLWSVDLKVLYTAMASVWLSIMAEICPTCGLPKDLCACGEIEKEQQRIRIRLETRKFGRPSTIVDGIDPKNTDLPEMAKKLKNFCACGGTAKNRQVMLQGDHRDKVRQYLIQAGYPEENIQLQ